MILRREMSLLEILISFIIIGGLFLAVGIIDFFIRSKLHWVIRFITRFIIIFIGIGLTLYAY